MKTTDSKSSDCIYCAGYDQLDGARAKSGISIGWECRAPFIDSIDRVGHETAQPQLPPRPILKLG